MLDVIIIKLGLGMDISFDPKKFNANVAGDMMAAAVETAIKNLIAKNKK